MSGELKKIISYEIGFGKHLIGFHGGLCEPIRINAVNRLAETIQRHYDAGDGIAPPNSDLISVLGNIAAHENMFFLTNTKHAASYVIEEHIRQANVPESERRAAYETLKRKLEEDYLSEEAARPRGR